jgi:argininosuccinate synthase
MKGDIPKALQALVTETQRDVTGLVRLKLYKGNINFAGRKSPKSLYDPKIATMEGDPSAYVSLSTRPTAGK